eukprot:gene5102-7111_t
MVHLGEVSPSIWDEIVDQMELKLKEFDFQREDLLVDYHILANKNKFNRELFERYGYFKDIILHPLFQKYKTYYEEHIYSNFNFDLMVNNEPFMPLTTCVIILFMLYKRVNNLALIIIGCFLFNVNPFYVVLALLIYYLSKSSKKPKNYIKYPKFKVSSNEVKIYQPIGLTSSLLSSISKSYDHILIGSDLGTLFTAAFLARNGHQCCVLQPSDTPPIEIFPVGAPCSVPLKNVSVGKIERYQSLLDMVQPLSADQRVTFSPIGTEEDGYTSLVTRTVSNTKSISNHSGLNGLLSVRVGESSLATDITSRLAVDKTSLTTYFNALKQYLQHITGYLFCRIVSTTQWEASAVAKTDSTKAFIDLATSSVDQLLHKSGIENEELKNCLSTLAVAAADEGLCGSDLSGFALAHGISYAENGLYYPKGGYKAIENALCRSIRSSGGVVLKDVSVNDIILEQDDNNKIKAVGVSILQDSSNANNSKQSKTKKSDSTSNEDNENILQLMGRKSIVSGLGVLCTYTKLLPLEAVSDLTKNMLSVLAEARPKVAVVYWLDSSKNDLGLSAVDFVETSTQIEYEMGSENMRESFASSFVKVWSPSMKDSEWFNSHPKDTHIVIIEFEATEPIISPVEFKQFRQTFHPIDSQGSSSSLISSLMLYGSGNDSITQPDHSEFNSNLGFHIPLSKTKQNKFKQLADAKLTELYPLAINNVIFSSIVPPTVGGHVLSSTSSKFKSKISAVTEIENFFLTGKDLSTIGLAGDIQGGWIGANAVLGYSMTDLSNGRNIATDLTHIK